MNLPGKNIYTAGMMPALRQAKTICEKSTIRSMELPNGLTNICLPRNTLKRWSSNHNDQKVEHPVARLSGMK